MAKYLLVSFKTCPWVQRAAIVLREKKVEFEFQHIEPDNRPDWFLAISPHKKVPVLRIDDRVSLFESNAIAEYLAEKFRKLGRVRAPNLLVAVPRARALASGTVPHAVLPFKTRILLRDLLPRLEAFRTR